MTWYSQARQDEWVHGIIGDNGYFIDVGAHDGIVHSNTYALEQRGWTGICVEPNREVFHELRRNRSSATWAWTPAISDRDGTIAFDGVRVGTGGDVRCLTLSSVLSRCVSPDVIDYLSIDVEGHELEVLAGMDFERWKVRLCTIEHNLYCDGPARKNAIHDVLTGHGFERVREDVVAEGYGEYEDWYQYG